MIDIPIVNRLNQAFEKNGALNQESFEFQSLMGQGSFGKVYRVIHKPSDKTFALKILEKDQIKKLNLTKQLQNEVSILASCNHPNIIKLYAVLETEKSIQLLLELANDGSLYHKLKKLKSFDEEMCRNCMKDVLNALIYLHGQNPPILHRDLKPENILIDGQAIKIVDFGWSNTDDDLRNTFCGTPDYLSPEMIKGTGHNEKLDVWTAGVLMYELLHGQAPFTPKGNINNRRLAQKKLEENILKGVINFKQGLSEQVVKVIKAMLQPDQEKRPNADEVLKMDFFKFEQDQNLENESDAKIVEELRQKILIKDKQIQELLKRQNYLEKKLKKKEKFDELKQNSSKDKNQKTDSLQKLTLQLQEEKKTVNYLFMKTKELSDKIQNFYEKKFQNEFASNKQQMISFKDTSYRLDKIFAYFDNSKNNIQYSAYIDKERQDQLYKSTINSNQYRETFRQSRSTNVSPIRFINTRNQSYTRIQQNPLKIYTTQNSVIRQEETLKSLFKNSNQI